MLSVGQPDAGDWTDRKGKRASENGGAKRGSGPPRIVQRTLYGRTGDSGETETPEFAQAIGQIRKCLVQEESEP